MEEGGGGGGEGGGGGGGKEEEEHNNQLGSGQVRVGAGRGGGGGDGRRRKSPLSSFRLLMLAAAVAELTGDAPTASVDPPPTTNLTMAMTVTM
jgi:hypothetical protein